MQRCEPFKVLKCIIKMTLGTHNMTFHKMIWQIIIDKIYILNKLIIF